jgi:hypothetical protein
MHWPARPGFPLHAEAADLIAVIAAAIARYARLTLAARADDLRLR